MMISNGLTAIYAVRPLFREMFREKLIKAFLITARFVFLVEIRVLSPHLYI